MGIVVLSRSWFYGSTRLIFAAATAAAAISAAAGNAAAGGRAEDAAEPNPSAMAGFNVSAGARAPADRGIPAYSGVPADPSGAAHPSVSVDLSVIDEPGTGPVRRTLTRPDGLRMPVPGVFPQSRLHEPDPATLPYATLTPPRQRAVNLRPPGSRGSTPRIRALALADPSPPPRPEEPVPIPRPGAANTSIGQEPVAITAPSRTAEMVAPASQPPQSLSPEDAVSAKPGARRPYRRCHGSRRDRSRCYYATILRNIHKRARAAARRTGIRTSRGFRTSRFFGTAASPTGVSVILSDRARAWAPNRDHARIRLTKSGDTTNSIQNGKENGGASTGGSQ